MLPKSIMFNGKSKELYQKLFLVRSIKKKKKGVVSCLLTLSVLDNHALSSFIENSGDHKRFPFFLLLVILFVILCHILQIFPLNEKIENINDQYWTLRAEEVNFIL